LHYNNQQAGVKMEVFNWGGNIHAYNPFVRSGSMPPAEMFKYTVSTVNVDPGLTADTSVGVLDTVLEVESKAMFFSNGMFRKYVVPQGANQLEIYAFGGHNQANYGVYNQGGFSYRKLAMTAGQSLTVITGSAIYTLSPTLPAYAEVKARYTAMYALNWTPTFGFCIGGTGALAGVYQAFDPAVELMPAIHAKSIIVAGGAASDVWNAGNNPRKGGVGGGTTGANGTQGTGGSQTAAGSGCTAGYYMAAGLNGLTSWSGWGGGPGGAGYYGGGAGLGERYNDSTGGGGSGYVGGVTSGYTQQGVPAAAPAGVDGLHKDAVFARFNAYALASKQYGVVYIVPKAV
jgi:hypothetical protein